MLAVDVEVAPQVRLRVRRWPGDGGPAYLLVHGLSSNARLWDEVAEILFAAGHAVSAVDLRSHGDSDAPTDGYDTGTAADDLAAVCAALEPGDRVIVGGQSWGGNVAVRLAARHPERVAALALVDGGWIDLTTTFESWDECEAALRPADVDGVAADEIRRYFTREHSDWSPAAIEASMANLREDPDGTVRRRLSIPNHMRIVRSMWDDPPWRDFAQIAGPVLLMPALPTVDSDAKRALVAKAAGALANATIREYVGADHDLHAHRPADVSADLLTLASEA